MKIPKINQTEIQNQIKSGTEFQQSVWKELLQIRKGETRSYADIARSINKPKAIRAVANAVAANKLFYQIPCHRVIKSNGEIGKYRWGSDLKQKIIQQEKIKLIF